MRYHVICIALMCLLPGGSARAADVDAGLTEALIVGTDRVIEQLGKEGGFLDDPQVRIPLPGTLKQAQSALQLAGMSGMVDDLELRMNRGAEQAAPVARDLIVSAVRDLTFQDAVAILDGPSNSATQYLEQKTGGPLGEEMRPIVDKALADAGAIQALESVIGEYETIPLADTLDVDLIPTRLGIDRFCPRSCSDAFELTVDIEEACPSPAAGIHDVLVGVVDPGIEEVVPEELKEVLDRV